MVRTALRRRFLGVAAVVLTAIPGWAAIAPGRVTDLSVQAMASTGLGAGSMSVTLDWTAPGAEGYSGALSGFFSVRWSTVQPITSDLQFQNAAFAQDAAAAGVTPGSRQSMTIAGLDSSATHYFVLKSTDDEGLTSVLSLGATAPSYVLRSTWSADSRVMALGDLDGDGDLDVVVQDAGLDFVLRRNPDGGFTRFLLSDNNGAGIALGDYDNDGDLDIAVAAGNNTQSYVARNLGQGTFSTFTLTGAGNAVGAVWGDFDNDRDLDLVLAYDDAASRLYRNGLPTPLSFSREDLALSGSGTAGVGAADFDNDGMLDLVQANRLGAGVDSFLMRNGGTSPSIRVELRGSRRASDAEGGLSVGDLDGDGDPDVIVASEDGGTIQSLRNDDTALNAPTAPSALAASFSEYGLFSSSGVLTLSWGLGADADEAADNLRYLVRVGSEPGGRGIISRAPYAGGDGHNAGWFQHPDRISSTTAQGRYLVLSKGASVYWDVVALDRILRRSAPTGEAQVSLVAPRVVTDLRVASIVSTGLGAASLTVTLTWTAPGDDGADGALSGLYDLRWSATAPLTGAAAYSAAPFQLQRATSAVTPGTLQSVSLSGLSALTSYYFALTTKDQVGVRSDLSNPATAPAYVIPLALSGQFLGALWADFDGDGDLDGVLSGNNLVLLRNLGGGVLSQSNIAVGGTRRSLAVADYDNDGDLDLAVSSSAFFYENAGDGTFVAKSTEVIGVASAWGDYDNDGDFDLLVSRDGENFIYRNQGGGSLTGCRFRGRRQATPGWPGGTSTATATWMRCSGTTAEGRRTSCAMTAVAVLLSATREPAAVRPRAARDSRTSTATVMPTLFCPATTGCTDI